MSFECDYCGKGSVERPGEMCSECQEREQYEQDASDELWYSQSRLCHQCANAWGPDANDKCSAYNMPLSMVKRKRKCKRFTPIDWSKEVFDYG